MDFRLTEEQLLIQRTVRDFAQKEIKPVAAAYDSAANPIDRFPWDLWKKAHKLGLLQLPLDQKWGGASADLLTQVIVCEEIGAGDGSFGKSFGTHLQKVHYLNSLLNEEQQKEFIPWFLEDDTFVMADASTEPDHGSDHHLPYDEPGVAMKTYAYRDGDEYVINGLKRFITLSPVAKLFVIWARTDKDKPITEATSGFLVRAGTPGLSIGHVDDELGGRLEPRGEVIIDNVRVPVRHRLGEESQMFGPRMAAFIPDFLCTVAAGVGEARTCYEETKEFARTRIQGGKPIIEHINVGTRLTDMHIGIEACRALLHKVAWQYDNQIDFSPMMPHLANSFVCDTLTKLFLDTMEIWAGLGVQKELPIERYFRNHFSTNHGGGTPVLNKIIAMKWL